MKTPVILAVALLLLTLGAASCTRSHPSSPLPSCTTSANTISVTDNGNTYCAGGGGLPVLNLQTPAIIAGQVNVSFQHVDTSTFLYIEVGGASFDLAMYDIVGPASGIGSYTMPLLDSSANIYKELFSGGQSYKCSGGTVNVTSIDSTNVTATFTLNFFNAAGTKVITGSLHANHAGTN